MTEDEIIQRLRDLNPGLREFIDTRQKLEHLLNAEDREVARGLLRDFLVQPPRKKKRRQKRKKRLTFDEFMKAISKFLSGVTDVAVEEIMSSGRAMGLAEESNHRGWLAETKVFETDTDLDAAVVLLGYYHVVMAVNLLYYPERN